MLRLVGKFPADISTETAEKVKSMLSVVYREGKIAERYIADVDGQKIPLLRDWSGESSIVPRLDNMCEFEIFTDGPNGALEGFFYANGSLSVCCPLTMKVVSAAYVLCEYLFPGQIFVYADGENDFKETGLIPALRWLKSLFPDESFDQVLEMRMNDELILSVAEQSAGQGWPHYSLYEKIAISPDLVTLMDSIFELESSIEESSTTEMMADAVKVDKLDRQHPMEEVTGVSISFFFLCLRRELCRLFRFNSSDPTAQVVSAAMSLNSIRNGSGACAEERERYQLPTNVWRRLYIIEWEAILRVLAYVSRLPVDQVRELTRKAVFTRGEVARDALQAAVRESRLESAKLRNKDALPGKAYLVNDKDNLLPILLQNERLPWHDKRLEHFREMYIGMLNSARCQTSSADQRRREVIEIILEAGENKLWFSETAYKALKSEGGFDLPTHAYMLALQAMTRNSIGEWTHAKAQDYIALFENSELRKICLDI